MQNFLAQVASLGQQLVHAQLGDFFHVHGAQAALTRCRVRNAVRTGNLSAARRKDSRATDSGTPSSSNKILPGRTVATQYSGWPLPLPMRVSGGREVTDLSGKMRIHSLPLRFMLRVRATRAASSCVLVIQARSSVCKPNSPKSILRLREAVPLRLPRWDLRYFTRLGINGIALPPRLPPAPAAVAAVELARPALWPLLLSYTSSISRRSCHRRCWLRRIHNRFPFAKCAAAPCPRDTIPSARFPRRSIGPSNAGESPARQNPLPSAPLFSSPGDKQCAAQFAARHF